MADGAPGDQVGVHRRQHHGRSREFLRRSGVIEFACVIGQPRGRNRLRRRQRVHRDVVVGEIESRTLGQVFERGFGAAVSGQDAAAAVGIGPVAG